jgi:hypothetical protein
MNEIQNSLNKRFRYASDEGDSWRIMAALGPVSGDCEDYSLTLVWLWERQSLLRFWWALVTFKYLFWHCRSPSGGGHLVVWCRGRGWTDNIQRKLVAKLPDGYHLRFPYLFPLVALKFLLRPLLRLL